MFVIPYCLKCIAYQITALLPIIQLRTASCIRPSIITFDVKANGAHRNTDHTVLKDRIQLSLIIGFSWMWLFSYSDICFRMMVTCMYLDSTVHGANMGPIWDRQDPGGSHVGPMNLAIWVSPTRPAIFSTTSVVTFESFVEIDKYFPLLSVFPSLCIIHCSDPLYRHGLALFSAWISNQVSCKMCDKLFIHPQILQMKFGNGWVILSHTLYNGHNQLSMLKSKGPQGFAPSKGVNIMVNIIPPAGYVFLPISFNLDNVI